MEWQIGARQRKRLSHGAPAIPDKEPKPFAMGDNGSRRWYGGEETDTRIQSLTTSYEFGTNCNVAHKFEPESPIPNAIPGGYRKPKHTARRCRPCPAKHASRERNTSVDPTPSLGQDKA